MYVEMHSEYSQSSSLSRLPLLRYLKYLMDERSQDLSSIPYACTQFLCQPGMCQPGQLISPLHSSPVSSLSGQGTVYQLGLQTIPSRVTGFALYFPLSSLLLMKKNHHKFLAFTPNQVSLSGYGGQPCSVKTVLADQDGKREGREQPHTAPCTAHAKNRLCSYLKL